MMNKRASMTAVLLCALGLTMGGLVTNNAMAEEDSGYGPGMMGGYGYSYGMGPGMMGGGYGMRGGYGQGMGYGMGGYGMMGDMGMMGGYGMMGMGPMYMLDLSDAQRSKIHDIQSSTRKAHFALMEKMADENDKLWKVYNADSLNVNAAMKVYDRIFDLRKQMMRSSLEARKQMDGVLTKEQREQMKNWSHGRGWGYHRRGNPPAGMSGPMMGH
jgi:Spy/CpxP family protein refolding chaperone